MSSNIKPEQLKGFEGSFDNPGLMLPCNFSILPKDDAAVRKAAEAAVNDSCLVKVGSRVVINNPCNLPTWPWLPDGHLTVMRSPGDAADKFIIYWSEWENYRTVGDLPWPETHAGPNPGAIVWGGRNGILGRHDSGGAWLQGVVRRTPADRRYRTWRLIGTYHAEDRYTMEKDECWKSIGVCYSIDDGLPASWIEGGVIISANEEKPKEMCFGGVGDHCYVYDWINKRHVIFYTDHMGIHMAISYDILARAGFWLKYHNGGFTEFGIRGKSTRIEALAGLDDWKGMAAGSNPSVIWSTFLNRWVMVWGTWQGRICLSTAGPDMVNWEKPRIIIDSQEGNKAWYPNLIGAENGSESIGAECRLYYADFRKDNSRAFCYVPITFTKCPKTDPKLTQAPLYGVTSGLVNTAWPRDQPKPAA
ncbi:hypothetical protein DFJ74DRAFT_432088 [Hyaloraphidium curvatum]|nr:hypothetical protein DFJ74DRAFT_432088 [Hyaloraphidium curvatum]